MGSAAAVFADIAAAERASNVRLDGQPCLKGLELCLKGLDPPQDFS
jgi:hypothetical protein